MKREYRSPHSLDYSTRIKLSTLSKGSEDCSFCSILYRGIYKNHPLWIVQWAYHRWNDIDAEDANAVTQIQMPWLGKYWDEIQGKKSINEDEVYVAIRFPKGRPYLGVDLLLEPRIVSEDTRFLSIVSLEFYTEPGKFMCTE